MSTPFKLGLLMGDGSPNRNPAQIAPGYDFWEIAGALFVEPLLDDRKYAIKRDELLSLNHPPISVSCWFMGGWQGGHIIAPNVDWDLFELFVKRQFARLADLGVKVVTCGAPDWRPDEGMSHTKAIDKALKVFNLLADQAKKYGQVVGLEPMALKEDLWCTYLEGVEFVKELGRPEIKMHADLHYFVRGPWPLTDVAKYPDLLVHVHIIDYFIQPGVAEKWPLPEFLKVLKEMGYEGTVSAACGWVGEDYRIETAKSLKYLQNLRDKLYA